jgi:hypothetical protein
MTLDDRQSAKNDSHGLFASLFACATLLIAGGVIFQGSDSSAALSDDQATETQSHQHEIELVSLVGPADVPALKAERPTPFPEPQWVSLFDQKTMQNWESTKYGGEGDVAIRDGQIVMELGAYLTGVTYTGKTEIPKSNYEVELKAARVDGTDFFSGLTFPVKESYCSLILGGWGGGVCGLSSLDTMDASENNTTTFRLFNQGEFYKIRLMVLDQRILAWIDGERIIDEDIEGTQISIRPDVELSCPLGLSTFQTTGAIDSIRIRKLSEPETVHWGQSDF